MRRFSSCVVWCLLFLISSCGSGDPPRVCGRSNPLRVQLIQVSNCSRTPAASLPNYDRLSEQFLDEATRHPVDNLNGNVVWGTRYYLESLLTAYEATDNPKYIQAFLDSGQSVLNLTETMTIVDGPDPGRPVTPAAGSLLKVTGWPTWLSSFSVPTMVPTQTGQPALYAQSLGPAVYFEVTQQSTGGLQMAWTDPNDKILEAHTIQSIADLNAIASEPLGWVQSTAQAGDSGESVGRIKPTGLGLPVPGIYPVYLPEKTIWNSEQAGGILLPFAHLLLLAKETPGLIDEITREEWTSKILTIAAGYEDSFLPDGNQGLRLHNPRWLPNGSADLDTPADYISVEATLRLFLYELTGDPHQFTLASGLIAHQQNYHWVIGPQGWLLLQLWPDLVPWSSRANAPSGSIWDSFEFDPSTPSSDTDGEFFADLLHYVKIFKIEQCLMDYIYTVHRAAFQQYLLHRSSTPANPSQPELRGFYPTSNSKDSDPITLSQDPFSMAGFLTPELTNQSDVDTNWKWMQSFAQNPNGQSIGYYLRAWARSEAAELNRCNFAKSLRLH